MTIAIICLRENNQNLPLIYELSFVNSLDKDGGMLEQKHLRKSDRQADIETLRKYIYIYRQVVRCKHMVAICLSYWAFHAKKKSEQCIQHDIVIWVSPLLIALFSF